MFLQESMQCAICVCLDSMRNDEDKCRISYYFMISPIGDPDPGDGLSASLMIIEFVLDRGMKLFNAIIMVQYL